MFHKQKIKLKNVNLIIIEKKRLYVTCSHIYIIIHNYKRFYIYVTIFYIYINKIILKKYII